jgi:CheY-like chemotaxis protein
MNIADATILIVDDEPELLEIFEIWLQRSECNVLTAVNGAEALKVLAREKVDVLISDIRMPIMDGLSLVSRIRELGLHVPSIIFVSGFGDVKARDIHALGVEAMLAKPALKQHLLAMVESSLTEREELWQEVPDKAAEQKVRIEMGSRDEAIQNGSLCIGRGGFSFSCDQTLLTDRTVDVLIQFRSQQPDFRTHGIVRWFEPQEARAGVQFTYVAPECREWVVEQMRSKTNFSFIPK